MARCKAMGSFDDIFERAAERHGGAVALEARLPKPKSTAEIAAIPDHRWLSQATRGVFQAGFSWKVIEAKWEGFEEAFEGFEPKRWRNMSEEDLDSLVKDTRIVRNAQKILSVPKTATMLCDLAAQHGTAARAFADWPDEEYVGLLEYLKKHGGRLGGTSGQYFLRTMGKDSFVLGRDVSAALVREGVVDKAPTGKRAMAAVQQAFNGWKAESGRSMTEISRVLALSTGEIQSPI